MAQVDDRGGVSFVNTGGAIRLPVKAGLGIGLSSM